MKKIMYIILVISLLLSLCPVAFSYNDISAHTYENDIEELTVMGLVSAVNDEEFLPDMRMTRGDFCMLAMSILGNGVSTAGKFFSDVAEDYKGYNAIGYAAASGYMVGYGDGTFRPDNSITLAEASKVLVEMLNYGYKVISKGYNASAYSFAAKEIGLYDGLSIPFSKELTRGETARLINNALDVALPVANGVNSDGTVKYIVNKDKTVMTEYLKFKRGEGIVSASSIIALPGQDFAGDNQIMIDDVRFSIQNPFQLEYVGYNVRYIYKLNDDVDVKELLYIEKKENKEYVINRSDYISLASNTVKYYDEINEDKERELKLSDAAVIIYNGQIANYSHDMFEKVKNGKFTFISSEGNNTYNVVYIEEYTNYIVGSVNKNRIMLTDYIDAENKINLDPAEKDYVLIFDADGNPAEFGVFKAKQSISVVENTNYIKVYINAEPVTGKISSMGEDTVTIGEAEYELSGEAAEKYKNLVIGRPYDVYFDRFGRIFYAEVSVGSAKNYLYFIRVKEDSSPLGAELMIKVYNPQNGEMETYLINEALNMNQESKKNISYKELTDILSEPQLIGAEFTEDGKIKAIETARLPEEYGEEEDGIILTEHKSRVFYGSPLNCFNYIDYLAEGARIISVPSDTSIEDKSYFSCGKAANWFESGDSYTVTLYSPSKEAEYVDVVLRKTVSASNAVSVSVTTPVSVVKKVSKMKNDDGEDILRITSLYAGNERSVDYVLSDELYDSVSTDKKVYLKDVKPGDVIITSNNGKGTVGNFRYLYDYENGIFYDRFKSESNGGAYYRILSREVTDISTNFVRLEKEGAAAMKIKHSGMNIVVVESNGKATFVKKSNIDDVEPGDMVLVQTQSRIPKYLTIIKNKK